jgi:rRNA maturation protein Nop10
MNMGVIICINCGAFPGKAGDKCPKCGGDTTYISTERYVELIEGFLKAIVIRT